MLYARKHHTLASGKDWEIWLSVNCLKQSLVADLNGNPRAKFPGLYRNPV